MTKCISVAAADKHFRLSFGAGYLQRITAVALIAQASDPTCRYANFRLYAHSKNDIVLMLFYKPVTG